MLVVVSLLKIAGENITCRQTFLSQVGCRDPLPDAFVEGPSGITPRFSSSSTKNISIAVVQITAITIMKYVVLDSEVGQYPLVKRDVILASGVYDEDVPTGCHPSM